MERQPKNIFIAGPIPASFIAGQIAAHQTKTAIGGHSIFLGQVRADVILEKSVVAIEYTSYQELALKLMDAIREEIISKYGLTCMHVYHSLGKVAAGEISLFVFTSSPHRKAAIDACSETVEKIKAELPIWGKSFSMTKVLNGRLINPSCSPKVMFDSRRAYRCRYALWERALEQDRQDT